jgi:hypothetical protein
MPGIIVMKSSVVTFVCSRSIAEFIYLICIDALPSGDIMETKY